MSLTLMCGLSFSGKSTFAALLSDELGAKLLSLDAINAERGLYGGQGIPVEEWARTNNKAQEFASSALRRGRAVVVDDTGSPRFIRDAWRKIAEDAGVSFSIVWIRIDPERQRQRLLANRAYSLRHDVTDEVMEAHVADFEPPIGEAPLIVDADDTRSPSVVAEIARQLRQREHAG